MTESEELANLVSNTNDPNLLNLLRKTYNSYNTEKQ